MLPAACPRCNRPNSEWTVERPEARAGCPCGEVIALSFDDEPKPVERAQLPRVAKKPRGWVEAPRMDGWSATLTPSRRRLFFLPLVLAPALLFIGALGVVWHSVALAVGLVAALAAAWVFTKQLRTWTFAFEGGRFRVSARGFRQEIALDDIVEFLARPRNMKEELSAPAFQLHVVKTNGEVTFIPLFVNDLAEVQFIADRANALLASGGHEGTFDYRGEPLRVENDEPRVRVALAEEEPAPEEAPSSAATRPARRV